MPGIRRINPFLLLIVAAGYLSCSGQTEKVIEEPATPPSLSIDRLNDSPRHQEWITLETPSGKELETFIVYPEISGAAPAVVLIHEIYGLSDWIRGMADQLAEKGFVAIVPDLLSGTGPTGGGTSDFDTRDDVVRAIRTLTDDGVLEDLNTTVRYARGLEATSERLAVAGFCWGGTRTWLYANSGERIDIALPFYGTGPSEAADIENIDCPVYGFFGENDNRVNATIEASRTAMAAAGKTFEPVIYDGAGHGFMRSGEAEDAAEANRTARDNGWIRLLELLAAIR